MTLVGGRRTLAPRVLNWDYEDRLTNINSGGVPTTNYGYNGVGSRVSKSNSNGSRTYKRNGVGVTAPVLSDGAATMVPGISEKPSGGGTNTILTDRLGSMKGMANGGNVTETAEFDAFGKAVAHGNPTSTQKGFASGFGYQEDGESGYKLLGHRYYDPETGRFLSRDSARDGRNWYAYCNNNPLKRVDPSGLAWHDPVQIIVSGEFDGVVIASGDFSWMPNEGQRWCKVLPGQETHPDMDVDLIFVKHKDGSIDVWFLPGDGIPGDGVEVRTQYYIDANGNVHHVGAGGVPPIKMGPYFGRVVWNRKWQKWIPESADAGFPKGYEPRQSNGEPCRDPRSVPFSAWDPKPFLRNPVHTR